MEQGKFASQGEYLPYLRLDASFARISAGKQGLLPIVVELLQGQSFACAGKSGQNRVFKLPDVQVAVGKCTLRSGGFL